MDADAAIDEKGDRLGVEPEKEGPKARRTSFQLPRAAAGMTSISALEQSMPADAVLAKEGADEVGSLLLAEDWG